MSIDVSRDHLDIPAIVQHIKSRDYDTYHSISLLTDSDYDTCRVRKNPYYSQKGEQEFVAVVYNSDEGYHVSGVGIGSFTRRGILNVMEQSAQRHMLLEYGL